MSKLLTIISSEEPEVRNTALAEVCVKLTVSELMDECVALDRFRRESENLYERVRALCFLSAIHRHHLPPLLPAAKTGRIPAAGTDLLLQRRFAEAIDVFHLAVAEQGACGALSSALAHGYHELAFHALGAQVRKAVQEIKGNQWMFRMGHPADHPLIVSEELLERKPDGSRKILCERTPVRMDLSHSGWSDIFFLGMDYPEGAQVLNISVDLGVHGREDQPAPPIEVQVRVIDEPVITLRSIDLRASARVESLGEVFDFAKDELGLLKAAVIASGVVPPGIEGSGQSLESLLERMVGPGRGIELVSSVRGISKGSRLAVSTNLLAALIAVLMRSTGQTRSLSGTLSESEKRLVLARAVLGEWLGGSGGGWQDCGGVWPGIKLISGVPARAMEPEFHVSRGRLLPTHHVFDEDEIPRSARKALRDSIVLVHGGMTQNVGPMLEMVTERYLLRSGKEWAARLEALRLLDEVVSCLKRGDMRGLGRATTRNFRGPLQTILPWATNLYTETLIERVEEKFGDDFWGFCMFGGMSGGGMGFIFDPARKSEAQDAMGWIMKEAKDHLQTALPFAMDPVVYDFQINDTGTSAKLLESDRSLSGEEERAPDPAGKGAGQAVNQGQVTDTLRTLLEENGFDRAAHGRLREDVISGRVSLQSNRLPSTARIDDVISGDVVDCTAGSENLSRESSEVGEAAIAGGEIAVVTLAAGAASRWTGGAGTCKALNPFASLGGRHRTFLEVHLAKSRKTGSNLGVEIPHVFTTSYLTHGPTRRFLDEVSRYNYEGPLFLSPGRTVGLRMIPTVRDLKFAWEELPEQQLDPQQQKLRDSVRSGMIDWARATGEAQDYTDNLPAQCLHPMGHFYEVPNLLLNGTLRALLQERPQLKTLLVHNVDTLGAFVDPAILGTHLKSGRGITLEVISRQLADRGGGLARVDGKLRLVEGLAMPQSYSEYGLSYFNSMTSWVDLDQYLSLLGLDRESVLVNDREQMGEAIRALVERMPTYLTLKEVKRGSGSGQPGVFPVAQVEHLWGDLTTLPESNCGYLLVDRQRGRQLKSPAELDEWVSQSAAHLEGLCAWS